MLGQGSRCQAEEERLHLLRASIPTFVIPTTDPSANRVLSVASMAALLEKEVDIFHNNPSDGTAGVCPFAVNNVCFLIQ